MTKSDRRSKAICYLIAEMEKVAGAWHTAGETAKLIREAIAQTGNILDPPPEMETVEVTQYSVYTPKNGGCLGTYHTKEEASRVMSPGFEMVNLTGSYQRTKKQPVEKSVSVRIDGNGYVYEVVKEGPTEHLTTFKHRNTQGVYVFTE